MDSRLGVRVAEVLRPVGEGRLRLLGAPGTHHLLDPFQLQGKVRSALVPRSLQPVPVNNTLEARLHGGHFNGQSVPVDDDPLHRDSADILVR
jgi:hypothetical protein